MSSSPMRQVLKRSWTGSLLSAWMLLAAAAAYSQTLKTTVLADGSTVGLPPYWWVAAQSPGSMDLKGPRGEGISLGAALPVYTSPPGEWAYETGRCGIESRTCYARTGQLGRARRSRYGPPRIL